MEKHSSLMHRKNQYHENTILLKAIFKIQCYCHQTTIDIFHRIRKKDLKFHIESKKTPYSQDNPKQKEQSWRHHVT